MTPQVLYVDPQQGRDDLDGRSPTQPLKTLTQALQRRRGETRIQLATGTYSDRSGEQFPLKIPSGCEVHGAVVGDRPGATLNGGGQLQHPLLGQQSVTCLLADATRLHTVTVTNPAPQGIGLWLADGHPQLQRVVVRQCGQYGVVALDRVLPTLQDCRLEDCDQAGMIFFTQSKGQLERVWSLRNRVGLRLQDAAAPLLRACRLESCEIGLAIADTANPVLRANQIRLNQIAGLHLTELGTADFGQAQDLGLNSVRQNGQFDIDNATPRSLISCGNDVVPQQLRGLVDLVASELPDPSAVPPLLLSRQPDLPRQETEQQAPTIDSETPASDPSSSSQFTDMTNHWAAPFVDGLVTAGAIAGLPDGTFRPHRRVTRAEFAAFVTASFADQPRQRSPRRFNDVRSDFWAYPALMQAYSTGFLSGFPDGSMRPDAQITRIQAMVAVTNGLRLAGGRVDDIGIYRDRAQIPSYAVSTLATATRQRLVVNYPDPLVLRPTEAMTRGEMAALIYQGRVVSGLAGQIQSPYIVRPDTTQPTFRDLSGHWATEFIQGLTSLNLVNGYSDGRFDPNGPITRAQFATLIVNAFAPPAVRSPTNFVDVPPDFWAAAAIQSAYRGNFLTGFPDQTFAPEHPLLRVQIWVALVNGLYDLNVPANQGALNTFPDSKTLPQYARPQTAIALAKQFITAAPSDRRLRPNQIATRAETCVAVYQALADQQRVPIIESDY
ncbi:MAG: S-layer homology domain-containing protein, partial [Cyanobacteria bacterium P01_D01_bin.6]